MEFVMTLTLTTTLTAPETPIATAAPETPIATAAPETPIATTAPETPIATAAPETAGGSAAAEEKTVPETTETIYATMESPVGEVILTGVRSATAPGGVALAALRMGKWKSSRRREPDARVEPGWVYAQDEFGYAIREMGEYFRGERTDFDFEYAVRGTPFQVRVWEELKKIPYGTTTTYGRITADLGLDRAQARAVGGAVGSNPLGIVVPCHRVIGADGSMTGYGGGLPRKRLLLDLETRTGSSGQLGLPGAG
jgi:methylated-DNA-[protein]-cysteine S-methyltransferase